MVGMKSTTLSQLSGFQTGISNVVPANNFTPAAGYNNIHNFSAPFIWDGTSNIVIETVFSNNIFGTSGNAVIQYNSPTAFQSTQVYRADNQNASTIAAASTTNASFGFVRPDFKLNGMQVGTYSWSPANGLSSSTSASVLATPTITTVYSATLSNGQCASDTSMQLTVILIPTVNISATSSTVCLGNTATLSASGASSYTWSTGSTNTNIVVAPFVSTTYTVVGSNPACPNANASIVVASAPALTLHATSLPPSLCQGESATLSVSGASTYSWSTGSTSTSIIITPSISTNYNVSGFSGPGCWASKVVSVKVNPLPIITISPGSSTICLGESITFEAAGVFSFTWTPGGSNSPILAVSPVVSTSYNVVGVDLNNCVNSASVSVTIDPCTGIGNFANKAQDISIFPNPSKGLFTVQFNFEGEKKIRIENSLGAVLWQKETQTASQTIDLSGAAKGVYLIRIISGTITSVHKLIID
jgi:hypothetical protein